MSSQSVPISSAIFADAIKELSLSIVYAKASEIQNSIAHLRRSNEELRLFIAEDQVSEDDKREIEGYIVENEGVIASMMERVNIIKAEVNARDEVWMGEEDKDNGQLSNNTGVTHGQDATEASGGGTSTNGLAATAHAEASVPPAANSEQEDNGVYL